MWDPAQYQRYADERGRPFHDLLGRVFAESPAYVVDLGCGPGTLTAALCRRWPAATVEGVDSSSAMVAEARAQEEQHQHEQVALSFTRADIAEWSPRRAVDVLVSNAAFQWIPGHLDIFPGLVDALSPGGWFAFQIPGNQDAPSHVILRELRQSPRWQEPLASVRDTANMVAEPAEYLHRLAALGCSVDAWETTYLHVLSGEDPVLDWVRGTALRPVLDVLDDDDREEFLAQYGERLRSAYPRSAVGTVLPFRRIFVVARKRA